MRWSDKRAACVVAAVHESAFGTKRTWRRVSYFVRFRGKADMGRRIVPMISDAIDAVDGAHSAASRCHRVLRRNAPLEGSRPWAKLARSVSISRSQFFKFTAWAPVARW